jgi:SAM-dependent methyltransferase
MTTEATADWYRGFFRGLALDLWRNAVTPETTRAECDFLVAELGRDGALLDVPCGNGRHALELARREIRVVGVDLSQEFIADARAHAAALPVEFVHGDMNALPSLGEFAGAYCWGNSFGYAPHAESLRFLSSLAAALRPGARFVLDTGIAAESLLPSLVEARDMQIGDVRMTSANHYDAAESVLETRYTFRRGGESQSGTARYHVYTAAELGRMLEANGFAIAARYAGIDRAPFKVRAPRLLIVARRV